MRNWWLCNECQTNLSMNLLCHAKKRDTIISDTIRPINNCRILIPIQRNTGEYINQANAVYATVFITHDVEIFFSFLKNHFTQNRSIKSLKLKVWNNVFSNRYIKLFIRIFEWLAAWVFCSFLKNFLFQIRNHNYQTGDEMSVSMSDTFLFQNREFSILIRLKLRLTWLTFCQLRGLLFFNSHYSPILNGLSHTWFANYLPLLACPCP